MATAATAVSISTTAGDTAVFDSTVDGGACRKFWVANNAGSVILLVNIPGLHSAGEWFPIVGSESSMTFELGNDRQSGITKVYLQAAANSSNSPATASFGVVSRVYP